MKIGFIGLGIMGAPMVGRLLDGSHQVFANDLKPIQPEILEKGATQVSSAREATEMGDVIIVMVPDTPDVEIVLFGENGVAQGLSSNKIVVDMSSISPVETKEFAEKINAKGCHYLDAPVSGGEVGAKAGTLTIMVGGDQTAFDKVMPLFELMGQNITLVGSNGAGQTCKVANQIIVALTIEAVGEALLFASKAGALEIHGERMIKRTFDPGFRITLHQKDLNLALSNARKLQMALPNTAFAQELFNSVAAQGNAELDHSAMVLALEKLAEHKVCG
jgi:2-hydroxy-3-oxopropionate reductase